MPSSIPFTPDTKTLCCQAPSKTAVLVTNVKGKHRQKAMRFRDGHAALDWCEQNGVVLFYFPAAKVGGTEPPRAKHVNARTE